MSALCFVYGQQRFQQRPEKLEVESVGSVGLGVERIVVDLDEEAVDAGGDRGASKERDEFGLAAADSVGRGGLLHGVGGVEDHRRELAHDGQRAEVDDEIVIAEGGAALSEEDSLVAGRTDLFDAVAHVSRRHELAFLNVDGTTGAAGGNKQIGLAAEERGDLQDVDGLCGDFAVAGLVNIGEDGKARVLRDAAEDARAFNETWTTKALYACTIGLVVAGFENVWDIEIGGDSLDRLSQPKRVRFGLDDTRAGNEEEPARAHMHGTDFER